MDTEAEAVGQSSTSRSRAKRKKASTSSATPPDAFQIILERIDGLREIQNQHTERMTAMQDQLDVLSAKFDSIYTDQEHYSFGHSDQKEGDNFLRGSVCLRGRSFRNCF